MKSSHAEDLKGTLPDENLIAQRSPGVGITLNRPKPSVLKNRNLFSKKKNKIAPQSTLVRKSIRKHCGYDEMLKHLNDSIEASPDLHLKNRSPKKVPFEDLPIQETPKQKTLNRKARRFLKKRIQNSDYEPDRKSVV